MMGSAALRFLLVGKASITGADASARDAIGLALTEAGHSFLAFTDVEETRDTLEDEPDCAVLVEDRADNLERLGRLMQQEHVWLPVIAFSPQPGVCRVGTAILSGAIDYLSLPVAQGDLERAAIASRRASARFRALMDGSEAPVLTRSGAAPRHFASWHDHASLFTSLPAHRANMLGHPGKA